MTTTIGLFKNLCPFSFLSLSSDQNILIINWNYEPNAVCVLHRYYKNTKQKLSANKCLHLPMNPTAQKTQTTTKKSFTQLPGLALRRNEPLTERGNPELLCFHTRTNISPSFAQNKEKKSLQRSEDAGTGLETEGERSQAGPTQVRERPPLGCALRPRPRLTYSQGL